MMLSHQIKSAAVVVATTLLTKVTATFQSSIKSRRDPTLRLRKVSNNVMVDTINDIGADTMIQLSLALEGRYADQVKIKKFRNLVAKLGKVKGRKLNEFIITLNDSTLHKIESLENMETNERTESHNAIYLFGDRCSVSFNGGKLIFRGCEIHFVNKKDGFPNRRMSVKALKFRSNASMTDSDAQLTDREILYKNAAKMNKDAMTKIDQCFDTVNAGFDKELQIHKDNADMEAFIEKKLYQDPIKSVGQKPPTTPTGSTHSSGTGSNMSVEN